MGLEVVVYQWNEMTVEIKICLPGMSSRNLKTSLIGLLVMVVRGNLLRICSISEVVHNDPDLHNPLIFLRHQSWGGRWVIRLTLSSAWSNKYRY